jgi:hypothetical protein
MLTNQVNFFYAYAYEDKVLRQKLNIHLSCFISRLVIYSLCNVKYFAWKEKACYNVLRSKCRICQIC